MDVEGRIRTAFRQAVMKFRVQPNRFFALRNEESFLRIEFSEVSHVVRPQRLTLGPLIVDGLQSTS
jgi:hypothetical protein